MPSNLDPSTASWTTSDLLAAAGENHTTGQQNGVAQNTGWLFGNAPVCCRTARLITTGGADTWGVADYFAFYHPAGYDYFTVYARIYPASGSKGFVRLQVQNSDGTYVSAGTDMGCAIGDSGWRAVASGTVSGLVSNGVVLANLDSHGDSEGKTPVIGAISVYMFGADKGLPDGWTNVSGPD